MEKAKFKEYLYSYIKLISSYLNNKEEKDLVIDNNKLSFFYKISSFHSLRAILYLAVKNTKAKVDKEQLDKLEQCYISAIRKGALFSVERNELYRYLNDNQIHFLPLKGIIIKDYYPEPYSREFADSDILFLDNDEKIKEFFVKRGYTVKLYQRTNHDVYLKKPFYNFEMHRALFCEREDNTKNVVYFKDYMNVAPIRDKYEHYLKDEDFYIYFTAHTYKHFHNSGCGIRTLIDYYLYLRRTILDFDYIDQELEKLGLVEFSHLIISLSKKLFDNQPLDEKEEETLLYIASSGTYGSLEHSVDKGVKAKGKFGYFMERIFPPYSLYKSLYPWAYKCPILIPIAWLCRFFRILFHNPKRATNELKMISQHKEKKED